MSFAVHKAVVQPIMNAMRSFDEDAVRTAFSDALSPDAIVHLAYPFGDMGRADFYDTAYAPLQVAMSDLERRDYICVAGEDEDGVVWVGCAGFYCGTFRAPFLDIPPTGHLAHMRFHEFYRIVDGRVAEVQALWDIPELMMQAGAWPMSPSLGREFCVPAPMTQDGLVDGDPSLALQTRGHIIEMIEYLIKYPSQGGPEVMEADRFWHPRMNWYGPTGVGTARGFEAFRRFHQIPFLAGMPDRGQYEDEVKHHFFAEGNYAAVTGWPNMKQTISGSGWLGIAPAGQKIEMRSLDFWRLEDGLIRENWVLFDLLDVYAQIGVDVLARMREMTGGKHG